MDVTFDVIGDSDIEEVLSLIRAGTATPRSKDTWNGNSLTGVVGRYEGRVAAILPLEPRTIPIHGRRRLRLLWHTAGQVSPELRGRGIGRQMIASAEAAFSAEYDGFAVYRDDPSGVAWRWYSGTGHLPTAGIQSFSAPPRKGRTEIEFEKLPIESLYRDAAVRNQCSDLWTHAFGNWSGSETRGPEYWEKRCEAHYYRQRYGTLELYLCRRDGQLVGWIIGADTEMRGEPRLDVLELVTRPHELPRVFKDFVALPELSRLPEIRLNVAVEQAEALNLAAPVQLRWQTVVLTRLFDPCAIVNEVLHSHGLGSIADRKDAGDRVLIDGEYASIHGLALGRHKLRDLVRLGACTVHASRRVAERANDALAASPWCYHQIDFV